MNIVIPMAGRGSRFAEAGCKVPKPMIRFLGKTMIEHVVDNLGYSPSEHQFVFIIQKQHNELHRFLNHTFNAKIVTLDEVTQGAACTVLLSSNFLDKNEPLLTANCDQLIKWNRENFETLRLNACDYDGIILTSYSDNPNNSYVNLDSNNKITHCKEKELISNIATVGLYYFDTTLKFINAAQAMIKHNDRTNNEFYMCPVYNYLTGNIYPFFVEEYHTIGTPETLRAYVEHKWHYPIEIDEYHANYKN
jgi:NDP-sugar pyrophosphorylase family protein